MSTEYSWSITGIKTKNENNIENVVVEVYWITTGINENATNGIFSGSMAFTTYNNPEDYIFIPFDELNEKIVLKWIKDMISTEYENHIYTIIANQIKIKENKMNGLKFPWDYCNNVN